MSDPYALDPQQAAELRVRFTYHAPVPDADQPQRYAQIRRMAHEFASRLYALCPPSRERSLALTRIEESVMWANASIARNESGLRETACESSDPERVDPVSKLRSLGS